MTNNHIEMDIASLLEVQVNEEEPSDVLEEITAGEKNESQSLRASEVVSPEEKHFRKLMFGQDIAKVRFRKLHCTSCDTHIGSAPAEAYNMQEHPVLKVLLCAACREFYGDGTFEQGDDRTDMFCRWCANGGNLYCCSYCSNTFCQKCIRINFDAEVRRQIEADEKWKCFVCHPAPLYSHRAICWAILQHVKTLSRILTADRVMTPKEVLGKMEQDDSMCCPGRKAKRKRQNSMSTSDDDSVTSKTSRNSSKSRKRSVKRRRATSRETNNHLNGRYVSMTRAKIEDDDITSLLNPVQTMVEGDVDSVILPNVPRLEARLPEVTLQPRLPALQPIGTQGGLRSPIVRGGRMMIPIRPLRRIDSLPPGATPHVITRLPNYRPSAPMVSIPTRPRLITTAAGASGGQPRIRNYPTIRIDRNDPKLQVKPPPSVIELESDSDNDTGPAQNSSVQINKTSENKSEESESASGQSENPDVTYPRLTVRKFDQNISNPMMAMDEILKKLRKKLKKETSDFDAKADDGSEINSARVKLKIINRNISKIVTELAGFNNTMVRQYKPWKASCITGKPLEDSTGVIRLRKGEASHKVIPVDMECVCDSESDMECDDDGEEEHNSINFSDKLVMFNEKEMVDRGCNARVETEEKGIQVYDDITIDYEKSIGYSLLTGADLDKDKEVFKPIVVNSEFFGKYLEEFIFYLQRSEDMGHDEEKENASPRERSLKEIIDADLSRQKRLISADGNDKQEDDSKISQVKDVTGEGKNINNNPTDPLAAEIDDLDNYLEATNEPNSSSEKTSNDTPMDTSDESVKEVKESTSANSSENDIEMTLPKEIDVAIKTSVGAGNKESEEDDNDANKVSLSQEARNEETVIAVRALIEDESRDDEKFKEKWKGAEDDDECTILE